MSFWGKTAKITAIAGMAAGGALSLTGAVLLGVGCNATFSQKDQSGKNKDIGVGASNFGKVWIDGKEQEKNMYEGVDYGNAISLAKETINKSKAAIDTIKKLPISEDQKQQQIKVIEEQNKIFEAMISANDERIAGAVLFPIFMLVLGGSLAIFFINKKKAA